MEGLEISLVDYSYVKNSNEVFRFDSNFFLKEFLKDENLIKNKKHSTLKEIGVSLLSFGAYSLNNDVEYIDSGVPFIRGINMKKGRIDFSNMIHINERANSLLWKSEIKPETVLLSMSGTIGDVAIASKKWKYPINTNQDIAKIHTDNKIDPYYLFTFLLSKYGQNYLRREARGSVQQHVFLSQMELFDIPLLKDKFISQIHSVVEFSEELLANSQQAYSDAESLLLETLGFIDFEPSKEPVNIKSFKESFGSSGRLDAEYFQKKYEQVIERIKSTSYDTLSNLVKIKKSIEPGSDAYSSEGLPFIRVSDYNKFGLSEPDKKLSYSFYKENKNKLNKLKPKKETILFSKDGSVGTAYMLRNDEDFVTSGAILHLTVCDKKQIIPEYLTLALNSKLVQMQAERDAGGSIILHWRVGEIENVVVPIIDYQVQEEIAKLVEESFKLKIQSEQLLDLAKTAVEKAIEENEETAVKYIRQKLDEFKIRLP